MKSRKHDIMCSVGSFLEACGKAACRPARMTSHAPARPPNRPPDPHTGPHVSPHPTSLALQVGILEMPTRKWNMICTGAHTDTVFSAAFQPANADRLATCSFDGSVRLWRTPTNTLEKEMVGEDVGVLYSLVWAPEGCGDEERAEEDAHRGA